MQDIYAIKSGKGMRKHPQALTNNVRKHAVANQNIPQIVLSYKFRLLPNKKQHKELADILESQRKLYNSALSDRIETYNHTGKTLSYFDQCNIVKLQGKTKELPVNLIRSTLKRLDNAYKAFFRRMKSKGVKAGFPRFRGRGWWDSFGFAEFSGIVLKNNRLRFKGITGGIKVHFHRKLPNTNILTCMFKRNAKGWSVSFQVRVPVNLLANTGKSVGLDMGLKELAVLSTGDKIPNIRTTKRYERELRLRQRHLSRCKKGSNGRQKAREAVAKLHLKIKNIRETYLHQVSAKLIRENDVIAIEDLNVKGLASGILAKSVNDAAWSKLRFMLSYKAERAGREIFAVDPRNTTQGCSGCGATVPKKLSDRWHCCPHCGLSLDRDHNAALNILARGGAIGSKSKAVAYG